MIFQAKAQAQTFSIESSPRRSVDPLGEARSRLQGAQRRSPGRPHSATQGTDPGGLFRFLVQKWQKKPIAFQPEHTELG